jgi:O-succinylhomoserine sulfhydrylase
VAHAAGALLVVDNCFCTPALQRPLELGADLVIHSATKYLDGQGRVLGGAVCGARAPAEEIFKFLRTAGPTLSAFNAWVLLKGLETLNIRLEAQSANALLLARWLEAYPKVARVFYPGLPSHPQYELAQRQQKGGGAIVAFEVKGAREQAFDLLAKLAARLAVLQLDADALRELRRGESPGRSIVWDQVTAAMCDILRLKSRRMVKERVQVPG